MATHPGLPGLGGLFILEQCPDLQAADLWNGPLLRAIKAIGWFDADGSFTRVRYRDLNTEELGSVYEGLLELHPQLSNRAANGSSAWRRCGVIAKPPVAITPMPWCRS